MRHQHADYFGCPCYDQGAKVLCHPPAALPLARTAMLAAADEAAAVSPAFDAVKVCFSFGRWL